MQREQILNQLSMEQVLQRYAPCKITHNRADCPLHGGDKCFVVYPNSFYCFSCGAGGDLIQFVRLLFNIGYKAAMVRLDRDFNLGIFQRQDLRERHKMRAENEKIRAAQAQREAVKTLNTKAYNALCDYFWVLKEMQPNAEVLEQAYIVGVLLDMLFQDEGFFFDYDKFIRAMRERIGGVMLEQ